MRGQVALPLSFPSERKPRAIFSACSRYRYFLTWPTMRRRSDARVLFALANPSTATAEQTDPTVARCIDYAERWGFGWCDVVNARAWRGTDPTTLPADPEAVGQFNDAHIWTAALAAELVVCGWGKLGGSQGPSVLRLIRDAGKVPHALRLNKDGSPQHPLYLPGDLQPFPMPVATLVTKAPSLGTGLSQGAVRSILEDS